MRRHAAILPSMRGGGTLIAGCVFLLLCMAIFAAAAASAGTPAGRQLLFGFDGSDTTAGAFQSLAAVDVDRSSGSVYVIDEGRDVIDKFDLAGHAQDFAATGDSSLETGLAFDGLADIAVDNSSVNPGRIYATPEFGPIKALSPAGEELWELGGFGDICGLAVDAEGHLWVGDYENAKAREFASSGSPPAEIGSVSMADGGTPCRLDLDSAAGLYVNLFDAGVDKYVGGTKAATIDSGRSADVTVDQSSESGHVFVLGGLDLDARKGIFVQSAREYDSSGALVGEFGEGLIGDTSDAARGVAYDRALDRVYVAAGTSVKVFGSFQDMPPDSVQTAFVAPRLDTSVRLNGRVNPEGTPRLVYRFEYSKDDGASWIALPDKEDTTESKWQIVVSQELSGLAPGTTYKYRLNAETSAGPATPQGEVKTFTTRTSAEVSGPVACPNEDIRLAQHSTYLGNCRAVELVNSPDKGNQPVVTNLPASRMPPMSADGEAAIWSVIGGAPGGTTATDATFLAQRTASGWQSKALIPPASEQYGAGQFVYSLLATTPNFSKFIFLAGGPELFNRTTPKLLRIDRTQRQEELAFYPQHDMVAGAGAELTDDASHAIVLNPESLQLEDVGDGTHEVISVMPDGTPANCGISEGPDFFGDGAAGTPEGAVPSWHPGYRRMSADGSRVYFEAAPNGDCEGPHGLYQRNRATATTTLIDPGAPGTAAEDSYLVRATPDGRSVYFVTLNDLDDADANENADIYRWDEATGSSTCLTCVVPDAEVALYNFGTAAVMISDDFSHIYFQSKKQLIPNQGNPYDPSIYVLSGGSIHYVAGPDEVQVLSFSEGTQLSADGNVLLFQAAPSRGLTTDAVPERCPNANGLNPESCDQLYRYDDRDASLECLSCDHVGETTNGFGNQNLSITSPYHQLSVDGDTAAFVTGTALLARDVNHGPDIYEWRNGVLHLLTDGLSTFPRSAFGFPAVRSISSGGRDIFISLVDPRTGFEADGLANFYDARIGGGFAPPNPPLHCAEESCQGPLLPAPREDQVGSAGINGSGNEREGRPRRRCANRHAKTSRRCRHRHAKKHRKHRRSHQEVR